MKTTQWFESKKERVFRLGRTRRLDLQKLTLVSIVVLVVFCPSAWAYDWSTNPGNGTLENPYRISTAEQLDSLHTRSDLWGRCFQLTADIDMSGYTYSTALLGWTTSSTQGFNGTAFTGLFDGNGHTISGLSINGRSYSGMFGYLDNGLVTNVRLNNVSVRGSNFYTGGIAAYSMYSIVSHCAVSGQVTGSGVTGGIVGENYASAVVNSFSSGVFKGFYIGGIVGTNWSLALVLNCYSLGTVEGSTAGGVVGRNAGNIANAYAACDMNGTEFTGGVVGLNHAGHTVTNCFSDMEIQTHGVTESIGYTRAEDIENIFGLPTSQMQSMVSFVNAGWDFIGETGNGLSEMWMIPDSGGYPVLSFFHITAPSPLEGGGTAGVPYKIKTAAELAMLNWYRPYASFEILEDIDLSGIQFAAAPIQVFCGTLDGRDHTISNLNISGGGSLAAFARIARNAKVKNLSINNSSATGFGEYNAILSGIVTGSEVSNCHVQGTVTGYRYIGGCFGDTYKCGLSQNTASCDVEGEDFVGCMAGAISDSTAAYCSASGTVAGNVVVGGLVGRNWISEMTACSASCDVTGDVSVGGLAGEGYGSFFACRSKGTVIARLYAGGLVGYQETPWPVSNCYSMGSVTANRIAGGLIGVNTSTVENCYSAADVRAGEKAGGFAGACYQYSNEDDLLNCFWDKGTQTSGVTDSFGVLSLPDWPFPTIVVTGLQTVQMQTQRTFIDAGWDFMGETANGTEDIWFIREGSEYPRFVYEDALPVAEANDIIGYASLDGSADVKLDGTGSYDADGDALEYSWYNDANELIATGAEPNLVFGAGEYLIHLVVNDGIKDSEPDWCTVTVVAPIETGAKIQSGTINPKSKKLQVKGRLEFAQTEPPQLDAQQPMLLLIADSQTAARQQTLVYSPEDMKWYLNGEFELDAAVIAGSGTEIQVTLVSRYASGQFIYGTATLKILNKPKQ